MKQLTLDLNGQARGLCFSKMAFLDFLGQATSCDPLAYGQEENSFKSYLSYIWAGMMCQCLIESIRLTGSPQFEPDFTKADVDKWLRMADIIDVREVVQQATEAITGKRSEVGEAQALEVPLPGTN